MECCAELGVGLYVDDDAVVFEADLGVFGVDEAGAVGFAADVVTATFGGEELLGKRSLEGL